jgi:hypothetical protein
MSRTVEGGMRLKEREGTDELLDQASRGEVRARRELLVRYRERLRRMVAVRMDRRLQASLLR